MTTLERQDGRVLVVEPDRAIGELLRLHLPLAGFSIEEAGDGRVALERLRAARFDLVILDLDLPVVDGPSVCRVARAGVSPNVPILAVAARCSESQRVVALEAGADDCLAGPIGIQELLARARALVRRTPRNGTPPKGACVVSGEVAVDAERRLAVVRGNPVELTRREFDLLYLLAAHPGIVYSRTALLWNVKGDDANVTERTIDTLVSRLRRKVEQHPQEPKLILTAWGVGYKFADVA